MNVLLQLFSVIFHKAVRRDYEYRIVQANLLASDDRNRASFENILCVSYPYNYCRPRKIVLVQTYSTLYVVWATSTKLRRLAGNIQFNT